MFEGYINSIMFAGFITVTYKVIAARRYMFYNYVELCLKYIPRYNIITLVMYCYFVSSDVLTELYEQSIFRSL